MADIVDINVFETIDNVVINATPNVIEVNINRTTSTGAVTSVNGEAGIVLLDANDIPETATKVFVTPTEKTAITHTNRTILDAITEAFTTTLKSSYDSAVTWIFTNGATLISHLTNYSNPHQTTAAQVGAYTTTQTDILLNSKVPYTGATANVDLGEFQLKAGQLEFDQTPTGTAGVGKLVWNDTDGTLDLGLKGGNVTLQVGQEQVLRVVNKTATNVSLLESNYQAVRVTGAQGQRLKVDLALATNDLLSAETIGLVTETIANNQEGFITTSGLIRGVNTTGSLQGETWIDGDVIYLSPTTAGNVTNIKPIAPNHLIIIGYVVSAHITQGTIFVKVDNGYELNELHNVKIDTPLDAEVLGYENSTSLWKNKSIATWLGFTPSNDASVVHIAGVETITGAKTLQGLTTFQGTTQTGSSANGILNLLQTWNTTGIPNGMFLNITDTASNASSLLVNIQRNGSSVFSIGKTFTSLTPKCDVVTSNNINGGIILRFQGTTSVNFFGVNIDNALNANIVNYTTAITFDLLRINSTTFSPTSGTAVFNGINLSSTINQTGGANGITRGLYINPTLTSAFDFRAIEATKGSVILPYQAATTTYPIKTSDYLVDFTTGTFTATLPTAVGCVGKTYVLKNSGTGVITIATTSSQTIDGMTTNSLIQYATITVVSNGTNWIKI